MSKGIDDRFDNLFEVIYTLLTAILRGKEKISYSASGLICSALTILIRILQYVTSSETRTNQFESQSKARFASPWLMCLLHSPVSEVNYFNQA